MTIKISNTAETSQEAGAAFETEVLARLYHGTAVAIDSFRDPLGSYDDHLGCGLASLGPAIYLTTDANGFGRFFAVSSVTRKALQLLQEAGRVKSDEIVDSWGVILKVNLPDTAKILRIEQAPEELQTAFRGCKTDFLSKVLGRNFRAAVLAAGYDGISYKSEDFPDGWEVDTDNREVVLYRHELANLVQCHDARSYLLKSNWSERGERGLKPEVAAAAVASSPTLSADSQLAWAKVDEAFEALNSLLDASGSLESDAIQRAAYLLRLQIVRGLQDQDRINAAEASMHELGKVGSDEPEMPGAAVKVGPGSLVSLQGKCASADLRERVLDLVYTRSGIEVIEGCEYVVARHRSTNVAIVVVDGNFSRAIYQDAMKEVKSKQLRAGRLYVYAETATYSGQGICFCKFEEIGVERACP